jgi:hypothetical protein
MPHPGGEVDAGLADRIRRQTGGVCFRSDLEFPGTLSGNLNVLFEYDHARVVEQSALGKEVLDWTHGLETQVAFGKQPGRFDMTLEKAGRWNVLNADDSTEIRKRSSLEGEVLTFYLSDQGWKVTDPAGDFRKALWGEEMENQASNLLVETGAHPRTQWFSSSRCWKPGARLVLTGTSIQLLHPADATGRLELTFEGEEAVAGHPCGVFSVSGKVSVRSEMDFLGGERNAEITVTSGKVWASLLYPLLLREEYDTVQTVSSGGEGGLVTELQGAIRVVKSRSWEPKEG